MIIYDQHPHKSTVYSWTNDLKHGVRKKDGGRTSSYKVVNAKRIRQMALVSMWMVNFNAMN